LIAYGVPGEKFPGGTYNGPMSASTKSRSRTVTLQGAGLTVDDVVAVARHGARVAISEDAALWKRIDDSCGYINRVAEAGEPVYGVTTGFGGMANVAIPAGEVTQLQNNLVRFMTSGAGGYLPKEDVRAALLLRLNSHLKGASGVRRELLRRAELFLNEGVTPQVREYGSIGASGDLAPLAYIAGALAGLDRCYRVDFRGESMDSIAALAKLGLQPLELRPKEGLAMINGTSVMTGVAANCILDGRNLLALAFAAHALYFQGLRGTNQSFHPYIHELKPHPGQVWTADQMLKLLKGSKLIRDELDGQHDFQGSEPIQDRYSLRCMPQFMGPIVDGLRSIEEQIETEANSANDNPLIDPVARVSFHGGNFLGQYTGVAMDHFRYYLGLLAKHLDATISLLVAPEFSNGLTPSLVGNPERRVNMGLKGLQICGNSIMPLIVHLGNPLVPHFPTHAEQFNQNINSQGFGAANLARKSVEMTQQYMAVALLFGAQAVALRTHQIERHYDARQALSPGTVPLYEAVHRVVDKPISRDQPLVWNDNDQVFDQWIAALAKDIRSEGETIEAVGSTCSELKP